LVPPTFYKIMPVVNGTTLYNFTADASIFTNSPYRLGSTILDDVIGFRTYVGNGSYATNSRVPLSYKSIDNFSPTSGSSRIMFIDVPVPP